MPPPTPTSSPSAHHLRQRLTQEKKSWHSWHRDFRSGPYVCPYAPENAPWMSRTPPLMIPRPRMKKKKKTDRWDFAKMKRDLQSGKGGGLHPGALAYRDLFQWIFCKFKIKASLTCLIYFLVFPEAFQCCEEGRKGSQSKRQFMMITMMKAKKKENDESPNSPQTTSGSAAASGSGSCEPQPSTSTAYHPPPRALSPDITAFPVSTPRKKTKEA